MEAMSPLVPGVVRDSAFPGAIFTFTVRNTGAVPVKVRLMEAQQNFVGWNGGSSDVPGSNVNTPFGEQGFSGLLMSSEVGEGLFCPEEKHSAQGQQQWYGSLSVALNKQKAMGYWLG